MEARLIPGSTVASWSTLGLNADAEWSPLPLGVSVNGLLTLKWLSAEVDCAEVSSPVSDAGALWATLPPRPSSETCRAVFVVWSPGKLIASAFVPSVMTSPLAASELSSCSMASASALDIPVSEAAAAISSLPPTTSTLSLSVTAPAILCEIGLNSGAAPELTVDGSDPETVPLMSTAVSSPLVVKLDISAPSASDTAALSATATAVLNATMMASSAAAAATFLRMLAGSGAVSVGACTTGITVASVVVVDASVVVVEVSVVLVEASVVVVKASVVVVKASVVVVKASVVVGGSLSVVPPLPSLVNLKLAVV